MSEKYDKYINKLLKVHTDSGIGGELKFVETLFSYIRRNTKLLDSAGSVAQVQAIAAKHVQLASKNKAASKAAAAAATATAAAAPRVDPKPAAAEKLAAPASSADKKAVPAEPQSKGPAPAGNGGQTDTYRWTQTLAEVNVFIDIPKECRAKDLNVNLGHPSRVVVGVKGQPVMVEGELQHSTLPDECTWTLEQESGRDSKTLTLFLSKSNKMEWWSTVVKGDQEIDTKSIVPESSKLEDLDGDMRGTVEKMMYDQRQKQRGLPTADEQEKQNAINRFMKMHPEMDFSQAKISGMGGDDNNSMDMSQFMGK